MALVLAAPAHAQTQAPETRGWHVTSNGTDRYVQMDGRLPSGVTCQTGRPVIEWGDAPDDLRRTDHADSSERCWSGDFHGRAYDYEVWGGTTYWYRAARWGCSGCHGETKSFLSPDQTPYVEEGWASEVDAGAATFRGAIADGGALTTWRVRYGVAGGPLDRVTPTRSLAGDGGPPQDVAEPVTGLQPATTYEFRFEATNSVGDTIGPSYTVTTSSAKPTVQVLDPIEITDRGARFRAMIDANGRSTHWGYCLGVTLLECWGGYGPIPASFEPRLVELIYSGLEPATTYSMTFTAENDLGAAPDANVVTFTTLKDPPPPKSDTPPSGGAASPPPVVPVSPDGKVVPPAPAQPFRAALGDAPAATLATTVARAVEGRQVAALLARRGLRVSGVAVPAAGRLTVTLRPMKGATVLARGAATARRAGRVALRLRSTAAGRRALRGRRSARLRLTVGFASAQGARRTRTTSVSLGR